MSGMKAAHDSGPVDYGGANMPPRPWRAALTNSRNKSQSNEEPLSGVPYGSYGRKSVEFETGGSFGAFGYFIAGDFFDEDGWRNEATRIDLSYTHADNFMYGDGPTPLSMLAFNRAQTYTPDYTCERNYGSVKKRCGGRSHHYSLPHLFR